MELVISESLGTIFYSVVVFVTGALIGQGLWTWISKFFPWNRK